MSSSPQIGSSPQVGRAARDDRTVSPKQRLAFEAEAWLRARREYPPSIREVCTALGASERTLHTAFREHLAETPKAHLKKLRLDAVRLDLLTAARGTRVTDVALRWGFLHFGWFSHDYRRSFGETPRETLARRLAVFTNGSPPRRFQS